MAYSCCSEEVLKRDFACSLKTAWTIGCEPKINDTFKPIINAIMFLVLVEEVMEVSLIVEGNIITVQH